MLDSPSKGHVHHHRERGPCVIPIVRAIRGVRPPPSIIASAEFQRVNQHIVEAFEAEGIQSSDERQMRIPVR